MFVQEGTKPTPGSPATASFHLPIQEQTQPSLLSGAIPTKPGTSPGARQTNLGEEIGCWSPKGTEWADAIGTSHSWY
jgi:hypothetical protein